MRTRTAIILAATVCGALLTTSALAQDSNKHQNAGKRGAGMEERVNRMAQELSLSDAQKTKLQALFEENGKKMRALQADKDTPRDQRQQKVREIRDDYQKKLKEILTPEQFQKMEKQREANREKFKKAGEGRKNAKRSA